MGGRGKGAGGKHLRHTFFRRFAPASSRYNDVATEGPSTPAVLTNPQQAFNYIRTLGLTSKDR